MAKRRTTEQRLDAEIDELLASDSEDSIIGSEVSEADEPGGESDEGEVNDLL